MQNEALNTVLAFATVIAVFVLAAVEGIKRTVNVRRNALPAVGLIVGLLIGWAAYPLRIWSWSYGSGPGHWLGCPLPDYSSWRSASVKELRRNSHLQIVPFVILSDYTDRKHRACSPKVSANSPVSF